MSSSHNTNPRINTPDKLLVITALIGQKSTLRLWDAWCVCVYMCVWMYMCAEVLKVR